MKISSIVVSSYEVKLKEPFITSLGKMTHASNLLVTIATDDGLTGWGECSPFPPINGETQHTGLVVGDFLKKRLVGQNPLDIPSCIRIMDDLIYGNSSIKSAFDIALYDLAAQAANQPLYAFLGGQQRKLFTDYTVSLDGIKNMIRQARWIQKQGFPAVKVKLGDDPDTDIKRIKEIRQAIGSHLPLRLDANQGWNFDDAVRVLQALKNEGVEYCEEPIPRHDFMQLPELSRLSPIPIMADESCSDSHDAKRLIQLKACPMFNIKLGKSGGIYQALKIIELSAKHGIGLQVGGFLESRLGFTASAHLALSSKNITHCDFDTPLMFSEDPVEGGMVYQAGGGIDVPDVPGLGAKIYY